MLKSLLLKSFLLLATSIFCVSTQAQVVINEVMVNPQTSSTSSQFQSLKMCSQTTYGNEYIELYNPTACPVDISCYLIGFNGNFSTGINGTFRFPAGSVIQPNGFLSIGGPNSGATINLATFCSTANLSTDADRWYLPNGDGYLILWDANGVAVDAVYWTTNPNEASKWGADSDISLAPTFIATGTSCTSIATLNGPAQIPATSSIVSYAGQAPTIGTVIHRSNDGASTWATNGLATINACNGTCQSAGSSFVLNATVSQPTCGNSDGTISFNPSPTDTYFYAWPFPSTGNVSNATSLAAGSYPVTITNLAGCSIDTTIILSEIPCGNTCDPNGNLIVYSNYNGGILTINVDQNIPNLKIGICTYEPIQVSFTGPFVGNITQVIYAGMNSNQNNNNCGLGNFTTSITGVPSSIVTISPPMTPPPVGYTPTHGNGAEPWGGLMLGSNGPCDTTIAGGGGNTPDEIVYYFQNATSGTLLYHQTQYACWVNETLNVTAGGNCCILPPDLCNLAATVSVVPNSACAPCNYSGPTILINELMISPSSFDGSLSGDGGVSSGRGEWIELFNPNWCDSVDISCYYLGNSAPGGGIGSSTQAGGYVIPSGTILPPLGLAMIRGINAPPVPANLLIQNGGNVAELIVPGNISDIGVCVGNNTTRLWFPNAGGWFAFYNSQGVPQDAVSWASGGSNQDKAGNPCIAQLTPCNFSGQLASYNQIPSNRKAQATTVDASSHTGQSIRRIPDGGAWANFGAPTYGSCNDPANCALVTAIADCNGTATVNVTSGTAPFTYQWNDPLNQTTQTASNLCDGVYQVLVTDADSCTQTLSATVTTNPFDLTAVVQQPECLQNNGSISLNPFSATYTYSWSPNVSTTNSASNLAQGSYSITITEAGCTFDTTIILQNPAPFTATLTSTNTTCGDDNGSVSITTAPAGNYTYTWTPNVATTNNASQLPAGSYTISISDSICGTTLQATILPSQALSSIAAVTPTSCNQSNGFINIDVFPAATYSYSWNPPISTADTAINVASGTYIITYTDSTCVDDTTIVIAPSVAPIDILANITATNCGTSNGALAVNQVNGGIAPYLYSFGGQPYSSTMNYPNLDNSDYVLSVQDANGCLYQETFSVPEIPGPSQLFISIQNPNCGYNNGFITIDGASGGIQPYNFTFNNQQVSTLNFTDLYPGAYSAGVVDNYGCSFSQNIILINEAGLSNIFIPNVFTPNNDAGETNEVWRVTATCIQTFECQIFNRWGEMVYEFGDINGYWDGRTSKGKEVVDGVYFYKVTFGFYDSTEDVYHGHITVIR
ncbi:MAG: hypothetical protein EBU01_06070 [Crocinitomicaceae bacterium]|nr:hypothetical protein [Crocinitomicaceae bacterium]